MGMKELATAKGMTYDPQRLVHKHDPVTSRTAAHVLVKSGKLEGELKQIHEALKSCNAKYKRPVTCRELSVTSGIDYYLIQKRMSVLKRNGKAVDRGEDFCTVSKTGLPAVQWEANG